MFEIREAICNFLQILSPIYTASLAGVIDIGEILIAEVNDTHRQTIIPDLLICLIYLEIILISWDCPLKKG